MIKKKAGEAHCADLGWSHPSSGPVTIAEVCRDAVKDHVTIRITSAHSSAFTAHDSQWPGLTLGYFSCHL